MALRTIRELPECSENFSFRKEQVSAWGAAENVWGPGKAGRVTDARNLKNLKMSLDQLVRMAFAVPTMCAKFSGDAASGLAILLK